MWLFIPAKKEKRRKEAKSWQKKERSYCSVNSNKIALLGALSPPLMPSFDPSSQIQHIIPQRAGLKWLLLLFSLFNSDDAIREIPSRWDFHHACVDGMYPPPIQRCTSRHFLSEPLSAGRRGLASGQEVLCCWSTPAGGHVVKYVQSYQ